MSSECRGCVAPLMESFTTSAPTKLVYMASNVDLKVSEAARADVVTLGGRKLCRCSRIGLLHLDDEVANEVPILFAKDVSSIVFDAGCLTDDERTKDARIWCL